MHEPDQVVLLKMPPVRVFWLKVKTENTHKEATKFTFPRVSQHYTNISYLVDCILNILQFLKNYINQRISVKVNNWKQTVDLNEKEQIIHVLCLFISSSLNSFYFISLIPDKLKADYFLHMINCCSNSTI